MSRDIKSLANRSRCLQRVPSILLRHKSSLTAFLCALNLRVTSASSVPSADPTSAAAHEPIFNLNTPFDHAMLGLMGLYLLIAWVLRLKTSYHSTAFHVSYALMIGTGLLSYVVNRDEFANSIRTRFVQRKHSL
jgi:hypothetical protein